MENRREKLAGVFGAIIIHLIAGIIFMVVKIGSLDIKEFTREYEVILEDKDISEYREELLETKGSGIEGIIGSDRELLNIARNLAAKPDVNINPDDYLDKVKEEMIKSGLLGPDNYIDEQKRLKSDAANEGVELKKENREESAEGKSNEANEMAARYSGPTRIFYDLPGRTHVYLPIPIYKCEGGGKVTLAIEVNPKGQVIKASVAVAESTTSDPCLTETAKNSALSSRFTPDAGAIKIQTGTLTYIFVPQVR